LETGMNDEKEYDNLNLLIEKTIVLKLTKDEQEEKMKMICKDINAPQMYYLQIQMKPLEKKTDQKSFEYFSIRVWKRQ
jgi:D-Tyr-tRNAtyr deacylase